MSAPVVGRQIGEPFNPWKRFNGIFVPLGLLAYPGVSDGAKLLYGRLGLYAGKDGACYAGRDTMAKDMGVHVATITRLLNELTEAGFIRRIRRGPGRPAICEFLYHDALSGSEKVPSDDAKVRDQSTPTDDAETRHQDPGLMSQECASDDAKVRSLDDANLRLPYKEEKIQGEKIHEQDSSSSGKGDQTKPRKTKKKISISLNSPKPETPEPVWYEIPGMMEKAAAIISESLPQFSRLSIHGIEVPTVLAILQNMTGLDDMKLWLGSAPGLHASAKTWGRYVADAKHWPARRSITSAIVERSVAVPQDRGHEYESPAQPMPVPEPPKEPCCKLCERAGARQNDAGLWEWCVCDFADALKIKHPNRIDEDNARVVMLRTRLGGTDAGKGDGLEGAGGF